VRRKIEILSQLPADRPKGGARSQRRQSWRPATKPPSNAEVLRSRDLTEREAEAKRMLRPDVAGLKAWLAEAAL
jgi:hypothetical protein